MIRGIHHPAISTPDLERALAFYRDLLGFETVFDFDWGTENTVGPLVMGIGPCVGRAVLLRAGNAFLELFEFTAPEPRPLDEAWSVVDHGITHICLDVDDVDAEYARLSAAGMPFHCPPQPMGIGMRTTYGRDPDGNVVEIQEIPAGRGHKCALPGR